MDFSFSFMQGIMGNTIQQPPQLIDSANIRQDDAFDASSDIAEDGGHTPYETALQQGFQYPTPTTEDLPPITNGYPPAINIYEPQSKYQAYSQYPNGSANGYGAVRNFNPAEYYQMENSSMRPHEVEKSSSPQPPPPLLPPSGPQTVIPKKTGSPEIKLKITKTIQNGKELFESSLCGDLLNEVQAIEYAKRKHERRKEKRKKSSKHNSSSRSEERKAHKIPKLEPEEQEIEQHLPSPPAEVKTPVWFQVGDLVWSKVGSFPWWPCMVSCDPQLQVHSRINTRGAREYHVQFFSNEPERAWVHEKRVREYKGHKQYDQLLIESSKLPCNHSEKLKMRKPRPQRERVQWEIGIAHAEKALKMSREERIEQYTFIYVDKDPEELLPKRKMGLKPEARKTRRSKSVSCSEVELTKEQETGVEALATPTPEPSPPPVPAPSLPSPEGRRQSQRRQVTVEEEPPPVKIQWKTAAARKSLPPSIMMHKGTLDLQKCNMSPVVKIEHVFALQNATGDGKFIDQFIYTTKGVGNKTEITVKGQDKVIIPTPSQKSEKATPQCTSSPETTSGLTGSTEKKQQRRSNRTRSESEKSTEAVPKKKVKKEQVETIPQAAVKTGLQKGASEISDSCKPLKKRSRASTDVEMTSSAYRDTSDSDSRGLNDSQASFGKRSDSPSAAADADASDVQSVDSSVSRRGTGTNKKDTVCQICECVGEFLVVCEGDCCRLFHVECLGLNVIPDGKFICMECKTGHHTCFSCKVPGTDVKRCSVSTCGRFYHEACVRKFSTAIYESRGFRCPQHCCTACSIDKDIHKASKGRMMRCLRCPIAYHSGDGCIAAGSVFVSPHIIVCSNHSKRSGHTSSAVNVGFCFVCARGLIVQDHSEPLFSSYAFKSHYLLNESNRAELMKLPMIPSSSSASKKKCEKGGKLLCCESCPASFHPDCLSIEMPEGCWNCNDCKAGKKLRYKQIVWVKLGNYRWWPAEICSPRSVPLNIQGLKHDIGDFPVFFFGSHDYYWVHQGRVFPYVEGDKSFAEGQTSINKTFKKALDEAAKRFQELKAQRESKEALEIERTSRKPPPYKHIKTNKVVGKVQIQVADLSEIPRCNCKPSDEHPCGLDSECLNRMLQYECHPQVCPAGERCQNQCFTQRLYPETEMFKTERRGWGLRTTRNIRKGEFVNEYVGELIDEEECRLRIKRAHENDVTNFYMLTVTKDRIIDAGPKGNFSRFMNHSCNPNCETQKWTVNGDIRVGLFALCDIPQGTELTFNYNLDCLGNGRTECHCGAENCSGFLGVRPKTACATATEEKAKNARLRQKKRKVKTEQKQVHEDFCFRCGDGGELVMCDKKDCPKAYHLLCLNLTQPPYGKWDCPWHQCDVCGSSATALCEFCPSSFCKDHEAGALAPSALEGRLCCSEHDPKCPLEPDYWNKVKCKLEPQDPGEEAKE
ncbi:histone-lysine N-methyltransferase NSD3 isoform X1 [Rhinatrema bivittatum]|uniref:histone-lysine N-methyltransferase NSD3 isoform X1 n=1 Tax=Rhinatrema bivittatum TaxID=194408 RepID=UPI00112A2A92|nr:histone-lysine N-methyltransferase NSD3 isoform X1 [Rhinatrema bivittatum]XP_029459791.1 histone-lysine N-methyltransferase NSD3 isoform X1 [Rhinatrema bivittatum]XP_029459792.1 histone-lysine N-methyltransferase NSD3 isoform X1 [Rhinatrema bivittatum]